MENLSNNTLAVGKIDSLYFHFSPSPRTLEEAQIHSLVRLEGPRPKPSAFIVITA
jgi:hypothetical protein